MNRQTVCLVALLIAFSSHTSIQSARPSFADDVPAWLKQAASAPVPSYEKEVPAVVLYDESIVTVSPDGRIHTDRSYAVRILTPQGAPFAHAAESYNTGSQGKVVDMKAWLIRPGGSVRKYGKDDAVDRAEQDSLYSESRTRSVSAVDQADAGMVFGYQIVSEGRPFFSQTVWPFQERIPSLVSRMTLNLPSGWKATGRVFNAPSMEPKISGNGYTWEMRNLAPIAAEPAAPSVSSLAPRVAVGYGPSPGTVSQSAGKKFDVWRDVSEWYSDLSDVQSVPNEAITQKARELTANARTDLEKIQAIAQYVQAIHYVSIQIGIGGYKPHSAQEVFAKQYGDCKDKANLMRAMLKAVQLESYLVLVYSGDPTLVKEDWPSPAQFNHCIIGVKLNDGSESGSIVEVPTAGRLLVFDPTDESVSIGDLPVDEQGSFALVAAGANGTLVKLPTASSERNRRDRKIEISLSASGAISANVNERSIGQQAAERRSAYKQLTRSDFTKVVEQLAGRDTAGAQYTKIQPVDSLSDGRFTLDLAFTVDRYAQVMQNRLLVFKPISLGRDEIPALNAATRKYPVLLKGRTVVETTHVRFPEGFDVDEIPAPLRISNPYAGYNSTFAREPGGVVITRSLVLQTSVIPPEGYAEVRTFFSRVRTHQDAPIVLARK
jgi:Domain of Unknown Function with PDB structure (DUF3857)/Transglutaminase-like superfamily